MTSRVPLIGEENNAELVYFRGPIQDFQSCWRVWLSTYQVILESADLEEPTLAFTVRSYGEGAFYEDSFYPPPSHAAELFQGEDCNEISAEDLAIYALPTLEPPSDERLPFVHLEVLLFWWDPFALYRSLRSGL